MARGNLGHLDLFLPPVKNTEVELNVPGLPRKAVVDSGDLKFVLSREGGFEPESIEMYVATVGANGEKLLAPFTYANVHTNGEVCWGRESPLPKSLAAAWTHYWTAPFNTDLAALPSPMSYEAWMEENGYSVSMDTLPDSVLYLRNRMSDRATRMFFTNKSDLINFEADAWRWNSRRTVNDAVRALWNVGDYGLKANTIPARRARMSDLLRRIKDKVENQGKRFVAVNNKRYMALHRKVAELEIELRELGSQWFMSEDCKFYNPTRQFVNAVATYTRMTARGLANSMKNRAAGKKQNRVYSGTLITNCAIPCPESYDWDGAGQWRSQHIKLMERARYCSKLIGVSVRRLLGFAVHVVWVEAWQLLEQMILSAHSGEYNEWKEKQIQSFFRKHYLENGWRNSLEFDAYEPHPAYFAPCDGIAFVPSVLGPKLPETLSNSMPVKMDGKEVTLPLTRWCFYSKIDGTDLRRLFHPESDSYYITNGIRSVELLKGVEPTEATISDLITNPGVMDLDAFPKGEKIMILVDGEWLMPRPDRPPQPRLRRQAVPWPTGMRANAGWNDNDLVRSAMGPISGHGWVPTRRSADSGTNPLRSWRAVPVDNSGFEGGANETADDIRPWYEQWVATHSEFKCFCYYCVFRANRYEYLMGIPVPGYYIEDQEVLEANLNPQGSPEGEATWRRNNGYLRHPRTQNDIDSRRSYELRHYDRGQI